MFRTFSKGVLAFPRARLGMIPKRLLVTNAFNQAKLSPLQPFEPHKMRKIDKINLPKNMVPIDVDMDDYAVVKCEKEDSAFLFTVGLSTCMGVTAFCKARNNAVVLGTAHLFGCISSLDFRNQSSSDEDHAFELAYHNHPAKKSDLDRMLKTFHPSKFNSMLNLMKQISPEADKIQICLGGTFGYHPVVPQLYTEYVRRRDDLQLCDVNFDSYKITTPFIHNLFSPEISRHFSVTMGISSNNETVLTKKFHFIDDLSRFKNDGEIIEHCRKYNIEFPPNENLVFGFEKLTWDDLHRRDHEYEFNSLKKLFQKKQKLIPPITGLITKEGSTPVFKPPIMNIDRIEEYKDPSSHNQLSR